ncbi:sarcosine oxidase subunit gamma [Streptomyces sp. NPDC003023]|uniref:sarcosine oxidase subunit gamma n=1 Tax=Streptomyces sp. NPDC003023 TaxID=3364675 RepID=UPI0036739B2C
MADPTTAGPATLRRSPLAHLPDRMNAASSGAARRLTLCERPFITMVSLRVDPASPAARRISSVLGSPLPEHCGVTSGHGPHKALWLGPDEWLVVSRTDAPGLVAELTGALAAEPGSAVDVSANRTTLELGGQAARHVLEKGCPLDLHPRSFGPGQAVATTVGPVPVLLWQIDDEPVYRLLPRASFADHLARRLLDAMREFQALGAL